MAKTNREILWWFGEEMRAAYEEKEEKLETLAGLGLSEPVKRQAREDIVTAFYDKMKEIERKPWYKEVLESARKEWAMKHEMKRAKEALESARKEWAMKHEMKRAKKAYQKAEKAYEDAKVAHRWKVEDKVEVWEWTSEDKWLESLRWKKDEILNALRTNEKYVKKERAEVMWHEWEKVHINLPEVWKFKWFKFEYFVSDGEVTRKNFEANPELVKRSYSMKDVWELLKAMNEFMAALGCETDWDMNYENELKYWKTDTIGCYAWECLKDITWLNSLYWLSDKNVTWRTGSRASWRCDCDYCFFDRDDYDYCSSNLFLRLS